MSVSRRGFVGLWGLAFGLGSAVRVQAAGPYREIQWDELVPADWDPVALIREKSAGMPASDTDPRAIQALRDMREVWDNAPVKKQLDGQRIRLPGYVVPLEEVKGELKEFLLVPYFGACIHTPPPPANQIVHVVATPPAKGFRSMDTVWVNGTLKTARTDSGMGVSGYKLDAALVERYVAK